MEKIARSWGHSDRVAALRWMDEHPEIASSRGGWGGVIKGWFRIAADAATNYRRTNELPSDQVVETIRYGLVEKLFSTKLEDATDWSVSLPDDGIGGAAAARAWRDSVYRLSQLPLIGPHPCGARSATSRG